VTPVWHDGSLDALVWDGQSPVAWSVAETGPYAAGLQGDARAIRQGLAAALIAKLAGDSVAVRPARRSFPPPAAGV
jgi:4'-phosphopantetheinyl transferase